MQLIVTKSGKAELDVNLNPKAREGTKKSKPSIFLEVFKPVGNMTATVGGKPRTLPTFYDPDKKKKDSLTGKLSVGELSAIIVGIKQFIDGGSKKFSAFAVRVNNNNERYKNLTFAHMDRQVGVEATSAESGEMLSFVVGNKEGKYRVSTGDIKELLGIVAKMEAARDMVIQAELTMGKGTGKGASKDHDLPDVDDFASDDEAAALSAGSSEPDPFT